MAGRWLAEAWKDSAVLESGGGLWMGCTAAADSRECFCLSVRMYGWFAVTVVAAVYTLFVYC